MLHSPHTRQRYIYMQGLQQTMAGCNSSIIGSVLDLQVVTSDVDTTQTSQRKTFSILSTSKQQKTAMLLIDRCV